MKPVIIIAVVVVCSVVAVLGILVLQEIGTIQEQLKQESLATKGIVELDNCMTILNEIGNYPFIDQTQNEMILKRHGDCIDNAIEKYGTDEIKEQYEENKSIQPTYVYEFQKPTMAELEEEKAELKKRKAEFIDACIELNYGHVDAMNRCIDSADIAVEFMCKKFAEESKEYEECMNPP